MAKTALFQRVEDFRAGKKLRIPVDRMRRLRGDRFDFDLIAMALDMAAACSSRDDLRPEYQRLHRHIKQIIKNQERTYEGGDGI